MTAVEESSVRSTSQLVSDAVRQFRSQVPDCIASGLVDMSTGMLLAADTLDDHPGEVLDLLAAATFDLFQGRNVVMIEDSFKQRRGVNSNDHYFQEILVNSENLVHLFLRSPDDADVVTAVICRRGVNIGMLFAQARSVLRQVEALG